MILDYDVEKFLRFFNIYKKICKFDKLCYTRIPIYIVQQFLLNCVVCRARKLPKLKVSIYETS